MDDPIRRPSNVDKMLLAGRYGYRATPRAKPVEVRVTYDNGTCIVVFPDGSERPARELVPTWPAGWQAYFQRIGGAA